MWRARSFEGQTKCGRGRRMLGSAMVVLATMGGLGGKNAHAFWVWEGAQSGIDARGNVRLVSSFAQNPAAFVHRGDSATAGIFRLLVDGDIGEWFALEVNLLQTVTGSTAQVPRGGELRLSVPQGQSDRLRWHWRQDERADGLLVADRLAMRFTLGATSSFPVDITVGRQAIGLATTYFFTPNDFFAPFDAAAFYRAYKPGVDAVRLDVPLGDLSQLSLIGVAGYDPVALGDETKYAAPLVTESAGVVRFATEFWNGGWTFQNSVANRTTPADSVTKGAAYFVSSPRATGS